MLQRGVNRFSLSGIAIITNSTDRALPSLSVMPSCTFVNKAGNGLTVVLSSLCHGGGAYHVIIATVALRALTTIATCCTTRSRCRLSVARIDATHDGRINRRRLVVTRGPMCVVATIHRSTRGT